MVRFVNDNQIPGLGLKQTLVASLVLDSKFLQGRSHLIVRSPEIRSFRIRVAGIDRDADVAINGQNTSPASMVFPNPTSSATSQRVGHVAKTLRQTHN